MRGARCLSLVVAVGLGLAAPGSVARGDEPAPRLGLWGGRAPLGAPGSDEREDGDAFLTVHLPPAHDGDDGRPRPTPAVVICPGGGYGGLVTGPEGEGIAAWLGRHGIAGLVLEYRLPRGRSFVPLADAARAIRTARARAAEWNIDPRRVGIMGFSAGGHLASTAATHFDDGAAADADPVARVSSRPDFAILVYPVIFMGEGAHAGSRENLLGREPAAATVRFFSSDLQVTERTPPTYLAHAVDDGPVPIANSRAFHDACRARGVESRLLELPGGGHGLDGYKGPHWDAWQAGALEWLGSLGIAPAGPAR